jgi:hypothetical protein
MLAWLRRRTAWWRSRRARVDERQERRHVPPPPGEPQPGEGPPKQGGGGAGFYNINGRLFAPLQGLNPADVTQGGYGWLSPTDNGQTLHPG